MESVLDWGVSVILWFQKASPALDMPFKALTLMGNETFYLVFFPLLYWSVDRRVGARLIILFLLSACVNAVAKELAAQPRPFEYDRIVRKLWDAGGGGFPSGHTQSAVVIWGYLASRVRKTWMWVAAGLLIVLVPFSRVYLGVHFPTDLLGGYVLGAGLLVLYLRFEPPVEAWLADRSTRAQLSVALAFPSLILILSPNVDGYQVQTAASLTGMGIGFVLEPASAGFDSGGAWWKRALRFPCGMAVLFCFRQGLGLFTPHTGHEMAFRFLRYLLLGLGGALVAPWIFVSVGLAERRKSADRTTC